MKNPTPMTTPTHVAHVAHPPPRLHPDVRRVDLPGPTFIRSILQTGIAAGHGAEGIASVTEVITSPDAGADAQAQR